MNLSYQGYFCIFPLYDYLCNLLKPSYRLQYHGAGWFLNLVEQKWLDAPQVPGGFPKVRL